MYNNPSQMYIPNSKPNQNNGGYPQQQPDLPASGFTPAQPNAPETSGYSQKNSDVISMVERYPLQIWASVREGMSLSCAADLHSPEEDNIRNSPLEMHTGYSVFRIAIASTEKGSVVANIPANDIPYILNQYSFQRMILNQQMMKKPKSPAYIVPIRERNCKNKTAVEVLMQPNGVNLLNNARKYFADNLSRYPKNAQMVSAIDEALSLYQANRVSTSVNMSLPPLYSTPVKPKSTVDERNRHTAYSISISGSSSSDVGWTFEIFNCKAFLRDMGKLKVVDVEHAEDKKNFTFKVTQQEMDLFIYRLQSTLENYDRIAFSGQYKIAKKHIKYGRN